jgi:hypothetical protein
LLIAKILNTMKSQFFNNMKKIFFLMFVIFLVGLVSADISHEQNTNLEFSITSNFATQCTLTKINSPRGIIEINQIDISSGTFSFNVSKGNYSTFGTYCHQIVCTDGTDITTGEDCRNVVSSDDSNTLFLDFTKPLNMVLLTLLFFVVVILIFLKLFLWVALILVVLGIMLFFSGVNFIFSLIPFLSGVILAFGGKN